MEPTIQIIDYFKKQKISRADVVEGLSHGFRNEIFGDIKEGTGLDSDSIDKFLDAFGVEHNFCNECGQLFSVHNDDGSCVED